MSATAGRWSLTRRAFDGLLAMLGADADAAGREYEGLRSRLVGFFDRRGAAAPESLADETLDRVARRLDEGEAIEHLRAFAFGVAQRVYLEHVKQAARQRESLRGVPFGVDEPADDAYGAGLERCLELLPPDSRGLILEYYTGPGNAHLEGRKRMAIRMGIPHATLRSRARRIREQLEHCVRQRLQQGHQ